MEPTMRTQRIFNSDDHMQPSDGEPIRSVVSESSDAVIVAWHVKPGQRIAAHTHPEGQDTWIVLSGQGFYQTDAQGSTVAIGPGDVAMANKGMVHGVVCTSSEPLQFISVVAPADAGYEPL
jgi:quercetin dioxygenase-like cupin family protein